MAHPHFRAGAEVEITSPIKRLQGTLFPGRVVAPSPHYPHAFLVEYTTLTARSDASRPSRRYIAVVPVGRLRPSPPAETSQSFHVDDVVHTFVLEWWWEGVITQKLENSRYMVYFQYVKQQHPFDEAELRLHREWVNGNWVLPFKAKAEDGDGEDDEEGTSTIEEKSSDVRQTAKEVFAKGALVEVRSDEDGYQGSWFAATIIRKAARNQFCVEYQTLRAEDNSSQYLREQVASSHLRPYPPETVAVDPYEQKASADALYNEGWWEGIIERALTGMCYQVYFKGTGDRMKFHHSELRPHQDWVDGKWMMPSRV